MTAKKVILTWQSRVHDIDNQVKGKNTGEKIVSPLFSSNLHEDLRWILVMYPKGTDKSNEDHVALYIQSLLENQHKEINEDYTVKATISFSIEYGNILSTIKPCDANPIRHVFDKSARIAGTERFLPARDFMAIVQSYHYTIFCEINAELDVVREFLPSEIDSENVKNLCQDFDKMITNSDYSDVMLVVSGKNIPAHKAILSARSKVFDALFKNDLKESKENVVYIEDVELDALMEMLRFIYTGKAQNLDKLAYELLSLADRYALVELKKTCEHVLPKNITTDNAISILILADRHSADNLKKTALNFIKSNLNLVINSEEYTLLEQSNSYLISQILRSVAS